MVEHRQLGQSSLEVSVIGIGALHFGNLCDPVLSERIIKTAAESGLNFIDTAPMYGNGNSETIVGEALIGCRNEFIIGTKVGLEPITNAQGQFGVRTIPLKRETIFKSVENSLKLMNTDHIDLLQLHAFDGTVSPEETFSALEDLVSQGKIRYVGASNYDFVQLKTMVATMKSGQYPHLVSLQSHYNIMERRLEKEIVPASAELNISTLCYRALGRGIITNKYKKGAPPPPGSRGAVSQRVSRHLTDANYSMMEILEGFSRERGHTVVELAISWLLARPTVGSLLLGMRNTDHLAKNVRATQWQLSQEDIKDLDQRLEKTGHMTEAMLMPDTFLET